MRTNRYQIVMLPTEKASEVYLGKNNILISSTKQSSIMSKNDDFINQHLYIVSNEEIKEGDYLYNPATNEILFASVEMLNWNNDTSQEHKGWKKVIATTDKLCIQNNGSIKLSNKIYTLNNYLPLIPELFIQAYIEAYNEDKVITGEVYIETEEYERAPHFKDLPDRY